jgi:hypothetical protein
MIFSIETQNERHRDCGLGTRLSAPYHTRCVEELEAHDLIPVLTTVGIESYNEGLDPIKSFVRWERELPQYIRKLRNQHVHYAQTIRILFEPITSDVELAEMMSHPGSSKLWKDKDMAEKLQERLRESYQAYQGTITDIERITKKIASKLDLDRATEVGPCASRLGTRYSHC